MRTHRSVLALALLLALAWGACDGGGDSPTTVGDSTSPGTVTDLAIVRVTDTTIKLQWTAPGDDGTSGRAESYVLKRSDDTIGNGDFSSAVTVPGLGVPEAAGTVDSFTVTGIDSNLTYCFALRARDEAGNVSAVSNNATWKFSLTPISGHVYNWAGTGVPGYGPTGQRPSKTQLYWPQDVVFDAGDTPYVLDWNNHRVIALDAAGHFTLIVGVATGDFGDPCLNNLPDCQGVYARNAKLNHPTQVAFDPTTGDMILAAWHNSELFRLDMGTGLMDLICGDGSRGFNGDNQPAISAFTDLPVGVVFDPQGRLVFADQANQVIRMIDENGTITSIAGTAPIWNGTAWLKQPGFDGDGGLATSAHLHFEVGQVADPSGKICYDAVGNLYIADSQNHCIRVVDTNGMINRFAGVGQSFGYDGDGQSALTAHLREPRDVAFDSNGNMFIADTGNHVIRMVSPAGIISTVAGHYRGGGPDIPPVAAGVVQAENGALPADITLTAPYGITVDSQDNLWISDTGNHVIRILYP